jgi:hypothetical protein
MYLVISFVDKEGQAAGDNLSSVPEVNLELEW